MDEDPRVPAVKAAMVLPVSDACLTCPLNIPGRLSLSQPAQKKRAYCRLRSFEIPHPSKTGCANHPLRYPGKLECPVGPVYQKEPWGHAVLHRCEDTEAIRRQLLELLAKIPARPRPEFPFGIPFDETVIWQLGEFREKRAVKGLQRVLRFDPDCSDPVFGLNRFMTIRRAREALTKIEGC